MNRLLFGFSTTNKENMGFDTPSHKKELQNKKGVLVVSSPNQLLLLTPDIVSENTSPNSNTPDRTIFFTLLESDESSQGERGSATNPPTTLSPNFFKTKKPECSFPLVLDSQEKVRVEYGDESNVQTYAGKKIYFITNSSSGKTYIGKTDRAFQERISEHLAKACGKGDRNDLYTDIRKNPHDFTVGILYTLDHGEDIDAIEAAFIKTLDVNKLYNSVSGGGGGVSRQCERKFKFFIPKANDFSPEKYYPFRKHLGHIQITLTPSAKKKSPSCSSENASVRQLKFDENDTSETQGHVDNNTDSKTIHSRRKSKRPRDDSPTNEPQERKIFDCDSCDSPQRKCPRLEIIWPQIHMYSIKNLKTKERYVGATDDPAKRAGKHASQATHWGDTSASQSPNTQNKLYPAMKKHPSHFGFGLFKIEPLSSAQLDESKYEIILGGTAELETALIKRFDSVKQGYNCILGGGGPVGSPRRVSLV